ncbi:MAG: sensor histidine kinase [Fimbriiglobus sp.]
MSDTPLSSGRYRLRPLWKYAEGLAPVILVWLVLVGWLASVLVKQANWSDEADQAMMREWLDETRNFRKTLPDLMRESLAAPSERRPQVREEIREQLRALAEPTREYINQLPGFPIVYRIVVRLPEGDVVWESPLPRPREVSRRLIKELRYAPFSDQPQAEIHCEYQIHAVNKLLERERDQVRKTWVAGALLIAATLLAAIFVARFLRRERKRDLQRLSALADAEHKERELLETRLQQREAEQAREVAERAALEMKSQLYASIGIMAGSYAHNIKNLLVRPNDLLSRCLEADGLNNQQAVMLQEVRGTLGTVTERLQQILKTVRRDPSQSQMTRLDLCELARGITKTWEDVAADKWKITLKLELPTNSGWITGDDSHLQQALENLIFNARDATFEERNHRREQARTEVANDAEARRKRIIEAAGWKGEIGLRVFSEGDAVILEIQDNGIGMTPEVQAKCLQTHFSTKRNNALYEGYNSGMGLGLSFVAVVLEHHSATLTITSETHHGTTFRVRFAAA